MRTKIPKSYVIECIRNLIQDVGRADVTDIEACLGMEHAEVATTYSDGSEKTMKLWAEFEDQISEVIYGLKINWDCQTVDKDRAIRVDMPTIRMCVEDFVDNIDDEDTTYTAIRVHESHVTIVNEYAEIDELTYRKRSCVRRLFATPDDAEQYMSDLEVRYGEALVQTQRA
jgi:hypothetical protein